jgi:phosphoribosylanthranilate isomerase
VIRIKICGVTRPDDAVLAADLGASAIGMVFWPKSPRCVEVGLAREIVAALPPLVSAVGVFVDQEEALRIAEQVGLTVVQFHGDEPAIAYRHCAMTVIKAIPVRDRTAIDAARDVPRHATVLLDAHDPDTRGGTGKRIDWTIAAEIAARRPIILSGGLNAANVVEAIETVRPAAIDVSSGVESAPGRKDPAKLRDLFDRLQQSAPGSQPSPLDIRHSPFGTPPSPFGSRH